jgi:hypothetical protein
MTTSADPLRLSDWLALPAGAELDRIVKQASRRSAVPFSAWLDDTP